MIIPLDFQQKTIKELSQKIKYQFNLDVKSSLILFQAPTGSGKTLMSSQVIQALKDEYKDQSVIFVWISISQGALEEQTSKKFGEYGITQVKLYGTNSFKHMKSLDVLCAGWSSLKAKSNTQDGKTSNFKKSTEKTLSLEAQLGAIKAKEDTKFILFIDEAHNTAGSDLSQEIIELINPKVTIDISATPKKGNYQDSVIVDKQTAKESGIIKQAISINSGLEATEYVSEKVLLEKAIEKRMEVYTSFQKMGLRVNPLVLVQLKNQEAEEVEKMLQSLGVPSNQIAVWLSGNKKNTEGLAEPDNAISFLICNQAVATGWDCPRAHILVQMLKASEDFSEQVIGRILRTIERKVYKNEILDNAFIYTITNIDNVEKIEEKIKTIHDVQYGLKANDQLGTGTSIAEINKSLFDIKKEYFEKITDEDALASHRTELKTQIKNQIQKRLVDLKAAPEIEVEIKTGSIDTQEISMLKISEQIGTSKKIDLSMMEKYIVEKHQINPILYRLTEELAASFNVHMSAMLVDLAKAQLSYLVGRYKEIETKTYNLPDEYKVATSLPAIKATKSLFLFEGKYYTNKAMSEPEKIMVKLLEKSPDVKWWFKNFDGGSKAFSLIFNEDGEDKLHFPDFIVQRGQDILFIETKFKSNDELEFPTNNCKFETFSTRKDLNYKMIFVDTKKEALYEKTGATKDDIKPFDL